VEPVHRLERLTASLEHRLQKLAASVQALERVTASDGDFQKIRILREAGTEEAMRHGRKKAWCPTLAVAVSLGLLMFGVVGALIYPQTETAAQSSQTTGPIELPPASGSGGLLSPGRERALKPKDIFKECDKCPEMVVVPAGSFTMGSPAGEQGRDIDESPQHRVTIAKPFAVGRFAVTFDEWDACVADGGCNGYRPQDLGWGRNRRPVINVSWDEATAYAAWLSRKTGKPYRLLTEAEWECAARAGSTTAYYWGDEIGKGNANCAPVGSLECGSQWDNKQTAPVGSFAVNAFGLYDMAGNVWQWVQDCYHNNYNGAPTDGSAWTTGNCYGTMQEGDLQRVIRGGSWISGPLNLRSAGRFRNTFNSGGNLLGFRVGRTLTP
jgi:formylglycine-generating enzyme required for sulfatase activity